MSKHTKEPWEVAIIDDEEGRGEWYVIMADGIIFARIPKLDPSTPEGKEFGANVCRIVACVNACAGINPEAVPDLLASVKAGVAMRQTAIVDDDFPEMRDRFDLLARAALAKAEEMKG